MGIRFWFENYTGVGVDMGGGGSGAAAGGRGKSSASVNPNPHWVWPSGVERTMHRQRERASVRTETRPVITTGVSSIYVLDRNIQDPKSLHVPFYCCSTSIAWFGMHTIRNLCFGSISDWNPLQFLRNSSAGCPTTALIPL